MTASTYRNNIIDLTEFDSSCTLQSLSIHARNVTVKFGDFQLPNTLNQLVIDSTYGNIDDYQRLWTIGQSITNLHIAISKPMVNTDFNGFKNMINSSATVINVTQTPINSDNNSTYPAEAFIFILAFFAIVLFAIVHYVNINK